MGQVEIQSKKKHNPMAKLLFYSDRYNVQFILSLQILQIKVHYTQHTNPQMKVLSARKSEPNRRLSLVSARASESIRKNLEQLTTALRTNYSPSLSISESQLSRIMDNEQQNLELVETFIQCYSNPYQCLLVYPQLFARIADHPCDKLFLQTTFPQEIHPILTQYLHKRTEYLHFQANSRKIIDAFYKFMIVEHGASFEKWAHNKKEQAKSIGEWFYSECLDSMFQFQYKDKKEFTRFVIEFMRSGIACIFFCAAALLRGEKSLPSFQNAENAQQIDFIKASYVQRYHLNHSQ